VLVNFLGSVKKFTIAGLFTIYQVIYAENEILGNIKCLLMPGCLLSISLLTPGSTVVLWQKRKKKIEDGP
jgi:hypothetical protein